MALSESSVDEDKLTLHNFIPQCQPSHRYCSEKLQKNHDEEVTCRCDKCSKLSLRTCRQISCVQQAEIRNHCYISRTHCDQGQRNRRRVISSDEECKSDNTSQCGLNDHENESDNESVADNFALLENEDVCDNTCNITCTRAVLEPLHIDSARPAFLPIWRGFFRIKNVVTIRLVAHLSTNAGFGVYSAACDFEPMVEAQILPESNAWLRSYRKSAPTDGDIGLYFHAEGESDEEVLQVLLRCMSMDKCALMARINNELELMVFSCNELPIGHQRHLRNFRLWGGFRDEEGTSLCKRLNSRGETPYVCIGDQIYLCRK